MEKVKAIAKESPENVTAVFMGNRSHDEVMGFYKNTIYTHGSKKYEEKRAAARVFWEERYSAKRNYELFYKKITG